MNIKYYRHIKTDEIVYEEEAENIADAVVSIVLANFNYAKIEDIRIKDYMLVCNALSTKK